MAFAAAFDARGLCSSARLPWQCRQRNATAPRPVVQRAHATILSLALSVNGDNGRAAVPRPVAAAVPHSRSSNHKSAKPSSILALLAQCAPTASHKSPKPATTVMYSPLTPIQVLAGLIHRRSAAETSPNTNAGIRPPWQALGCTAVAP